MRDRDGETVDARDVLDDEEYAAYRYQRDKTGRGISVHTKPHRFDELGYDMRTGNWEPGHEPGDRE